MEFVPSLVHKPMSSGLQLQVIDYNPDDLWKRIERRRIIDNH